MQYFNEIVSVVKISKMTTSVKSRKSEDVAASTTFSMTPLSLAPSSLSHLEGILLNHNEDSVSSSTYSNHSNDENNHAENSLERMYQCYEEGKLCDVTLVVGANEIKTHRLVLNSFSLFFSGLFDDCWSDSKKDKIEIKELDEEALKCILQFAYTGELKLNLSNVLKVLAASNFLQLIQLNFVKESVGDYLKERVNKDNCATMLAIAEQFSVVQLKVFLIKYAARNFFQASQSEHFFKQPVELFLEILQSNVLVVDLGRDFLPRHMEQEDFILDVVLKYVTHQCDNNQQSDFTHQCDNNQQSDLLLAELIKHHIRVLCLSPSSLEKLHQFALDAGLGESLELIMEAQEGNASENEHVTLWRTEREGGISKEIFGKKVHGGRVNVGPIQSKFGSEFTGPDNPDLFIRGMIIWIRLWDNHSVIGGIKVFYSNGQSPMYGGNDEDKEVHEFHLDDDERIIKAKICSGWMVDSLTFFTNKGRKLGRYGGDGGAKKTEKPRGRYNFLSRLTGVVVKTQEKLAVINLRLVWRKFMVDRDLDTVHIESNGSSDFSDSSDNEQ